MIDILLLNPPPVVLKDLFAEPVMYSTPPLGIGYLASALRSAGYSVALYDMGPQRKGLEDIKKIIKENQIKIIGISSFIANHGNGMRIAKVIKDTFSDTVSVVMGGPQASFIPDEILLKGNVDYISMFEGEVTLVELVSTILKGLNPESVEGIAFLRAGKVYKTPARKSIECIDEIAFPAWDLFDLNAYPSPGIILTGRGCPYKCIFCSASIVSGARYRMRSVDNVVDELEMLNKQYGLRSFFFADDTFTASKEHCIEICREIRRRELRITWEAEARANTVTDEIAAEMYKAGCRHVQIGAESGDDYILKTIGKNVTTKTIENAVKTFLRHGISVVCSFILGNPDDTVDTCYKTIDFAVRIKNLSPAYASCKFSILTPLPGTPVYEKRDEIGIKILTNNWDNYTFFDAVMETKNLTRQQLQNIYLDSWVKYVS